MRENRMKRLLAEGRPALGCSVMIPSPQAVELVAGVGFDWVLIDMEHGTIGLETAELMVMAAEARGITPIIRPPTNARWAISAAMDRGAQGVQVPHVDTAADARDAVDAVRFGPGDKRGLAAGTRSGDYGLGLAVGDYIARTAAESLVCVQIEHAAALAHVEEMLEVEGVDVFFIGPSDLSQSMGHPGDPKAPAVAAAIDQVLGKILAAGKTPGMPATADNVGTLIERGVRYIYTHLPRLLADGSRGFFAAARR